ncbi:TolC family protein [Rufibacter glacialis]|uniref:TolC family protein n=1 Tax=Rufibacter glacialis TaxID=1259555 RepID=A0A5M8Q7D3_9BACT|nr:TolC family protein [Rufibacter glacialis]KAA6430730.1 TolC family protein [Rufibacter glacialis]GGK86290.1 outer membrane efflux protein [Rufibacter glacialis]
MRKNKYLLPLLLSCLLAPWALWAQVTPDSTAGRLSLEQCVEYALKNQAQVQQAQLEEEIGERQIRAQLSGWLPQVSANYALTHNLKRPQTVFGDQVITVGQKYTSNLNLQANQTLYSNDLLLASRAARFTRTALDLNTQSTKINTVVEVSKAFYNVLLSQEQLRILNENITRQEKQYRDARAQYEQGLVDKTDYQRASITLNSIKADRKRTQEAIKASTALLQELMGLPLGSSLSLAYDYNQMQQNILVDTTQNVTFANRVEFQQLRTQRQIQDLNTRYYRWGFLPTASAFVNYNPTYFSSTFSDIYRQAYPTSAVGLQVGIPIFQGGRRLQNVRISELQAQSLDVELTNIQRRINTEYQRALANYKSDYNDWLTLQENVRLAEEVYNVIRLQYNEGIKTYLELIVAETDLRTAQLNYYNSLYNVLASKLDVQRALGTIAVN